jgi:uncharacterized membrane protein (DUF4010 family)
MAAIIFATAMMYLRILILILVFSPSLFLRIWPSFLVLFLCSTLTGVFVLFFRNRLITSKDEGLQTDTNPLEFKVALIFTALYIAFTFITYAVLRRYGAPGLNILSLLVGLTDIDPFLINLFQGKLGIPADAIVLATLQSIISNNTLKMIYGCFFAGKNARIYLVSGFLLIIAVTIITAIIV